MKIASCCCDGTTLKMARKPGKLQKEIPARRSLRARSGGRRPSLKYIFSNIFFFYSQFFFQNFKSVQIYMIYAECNGVYIGGAIGPWLPPWRQLIEKSAEIPTIFWFLCYTMEMAKFKDFVIVFEFLVIGNRDVMQYFLL